MSVQRRQFLVGGAVAVSLAQSFAARAQQGERMRRVGVLVPSFAQTDREGQARIVAFVNSLRKLGWVEGRNIKFTYRFAAGNAERLKTAAEELVGSAPDVIVSVANVALAELKQLSSTIPIVFAQVGDPVGSGFVASLARPGGNITGFQSIQSSMAGKWLGVLKETAPDIVRAALIYGSDAANNLEFLHVAVAGGQSIGVAVTGIDVMSANMERAITDFAGRSGGGLIVAPHAYVVANRGVIFSLAARYRLPAVYPDHYFAADGGLMSYGPDQLEQWRGAAIYVDHVLRGEKPADLPVQGPTKFELVINLKTAKALGLEVPAQLLARADEVIE